MKQAADTAGNVSLLGLKSREAALYIQASAAIKRRAVSLFQRLSTPGRQPALRRSGRLFANGGILKTAAFYTLLLLSLTTGIGSSSAHAQMVCPVPTARALDEAQEILQANDRIKFDVALVCLTQALAQTRSDLDALREGRLAFSGQIHAPKGFVMSKSFVQEAR